MNRDICLGMAETPEKEVARGSGQLKPRVTEEEVLALLQRKREQKAETPAQYRERSRLRKAKYYAENREKILSTRKQLKNEDPGFRVLMNFRHMERLRSDRAYRRTTPVLLKRCRCDRLFSCCAPGQAVRREVSIQCVLQEMPPLPHPLETFAVRSSTASSREERTDHGTGEALKKSQRLFECNLCQFSTPKLPVLKLHLEKHSREDMYKCEVCEALFMRLDTYKAHMCKHTGEKLYHCNLCPHSTSYEGAFKRHMTTHLNTRPFACTMCPHRCNTKTNLRRHLSTHTGKTPFKCSMCHLSFSQKQFLTAHMQQHLVS